MLVTVMTPGSPVNTRLRGSSHILWAARALQGLEEEASVLQENTFIVVVTRVRDASQCLSQREEATNSTVG